VSSEGGALHSSLPGGRSDCRLLFKGGVLVATFPTGDKMKLDLRRATFDRHGPGGRNFAYADGQSGGITLICRDVKLHEAVIASGFFRPLPEAQSVAPSGRSGSALRNPRATKGSSSPTAPAGGMTRAQRIVLFSAIASIVLFSIPFLLAGPLGRFAVRFVPTTVDQEIGQEGVREAIAQISRGGAGEISDPKIRSVVDAVMKRITVPVERQVRERGWRFDVHILDSRMVNAFALPGGPVLVTTAMLEFLESPEELAGVLSHEISHVTRRHGVERMVRDQGLSLVLRGDSSISKVLVAQAAWLGSMSYSRENENEADASGVSLCLDSAVDPRGLPAFFERLSGLSGAGGFSLSHPVTKDRVANMKKRIGASTRRDFLSIDADWATMDAVLQSLADKRREKGRSSDDEWFGPGQH
jgi:Zn-dependent protease with chaperone function